MDPFALQLKQRMDKRVRFGEQSGQGVEYGSRQLETGREAMQCLIYNKQDPIVYSVITESQCKGERTVIMANSGK